MCNVSETLIVTYEENLYMVASDIVEHLLFAMLINLSRNYDYSGNYRFRVPYHSRIPMAMPLQQMIPMPAQDQASGMWR